jgi:signal transduction histidine kinase
VSAAATARPRHVRSRFVLTSVALVAVAALVLSALAYVLVARSLRSEVLERAIEEARFNVAVLAQERLGPTVEPGDIEASGLADDLRRRDLDVFVDLGDAGDYVSGLDVVAAPAAVSPALQTVVASGRVGAEWVQVEGRPFLVTGARRPPDGPDFYFFTDVGGIEAALAQLRLVLLGASLLLVLVGGLAGWRLARVTGSLADTVDELTAARDRERRFVADVSHELRTPVTALVHEAAELADAIDDLPTGRRRVVELLDRDVRRLRDLVEELLELSRIDATSQPADLQLGEIDVARFLDAIVARRLHDALVQAPSGLRVRADHRRLERIVSNLVDNARLHADGRGVTVAAKLDGTTLRIAVADRGPGVPADQLARIFDRFAKGDAARAGGGSGLGLAIVREHVRVLQGTVEARSRAGGGLVVEVQVPVGLVADL